MRIDPEVRSIIEEFINDFDGGVETEEFPSIVGFWVDRFRTMLSDGSAS